MMPCSLLVLVLVVVIAINVFILASRKRGPRVSDPSCGRCGYAVRGLPTFTCPECGADLREVGIVTPGHSGMSPRMRGVLLVLIWTLALPVAAFVATIVIVTAIPQTTTTTAKRILNSPKPNAYDEIHLTQVRADRGSARMSNILTVTLILAEAGPSPMTVDSMNHGYSYRSKTGSEVRADADPDTRAFLDWMAEAGIDAQNAQVKLEAAELATLARGAGADLVTNLPVKHFFIGGTSTNSYTGPESWLLAVVGVFWLVVWLLGCWKLWKIGTRG